MAVSDKSQASRFGKNTAGQRQSAWRYRLILAGAGCLALLISLTPLASQIDNYAADWLFRLQPPEPWQPASAILAIDDDSLRQIGGVRNLRPALAKALEAAARARPLAIVVDVILADTGDTAEDLRLRDTLRSARNVILATELIEVGRWEDPLPIFQRAAAGLGHDHADPDYEDGMSRFMPLEKIAGRTRRWALSLEAYRQAHGIPITETQDGLEVGDLHIPAPRSNGRLMRIRYLPPNADLSSRIPHVSLRTLLEEQSGAEAFRDKVVFVGATAQNALRDRMMTPYTTRRPMPGVEIHAHAFETLEQGRFLTNVSPSLALLLSAAIVAVAGFIFGRWSGIQSYAAGALLILGAHAMPHLFFLNGWVLPYVAPVSAAWFGVLAAAGYQYFQTRDTLHRTEGERSRYQEAIQFVAHEMRTPLSAIQGSSELMNRYKLNEEKQKQLVQQIHSESKRLSGMITTFLNVERLSAGQLQMKREPFDVPEILEQCVARVRPLAERKSIRVTLHEPRPAAITGDRELMEYAVYNLLTNAVKYSPADTHVEIFTSLSGDYIRIAIKDQGIGMDAQELENIFGKFYRTKKAEQSGEIGTGIGLSIVQQIITHHGGRIEVTSTPGSGSCFTMIIPAKSTAIEFVRKSET